jgi:hypothetical protein
MLYGRARKLDVSHLTGHTCPEHIFERITARPKGDATSLRQQARQARNEWRRQRYSRLFAREQPGFLKTFLFSRPAPR